jgi:spore maturation protein CgeB
MRILISYPGHSISTFDVARGWDRALRNLGHEVFQMNYEHNVPFYGVVIDYWKERNPDFQPTMRDVFWLASQDFICKALECLPLDFVLIVTGLLHHPRAFELIRKLGVPTVLLFTESPYNDDMLEELLPLPDVVFTNERNSVEAFQSVNPNSFYMPHSYDPEVHHPPNGEMYEHDVFFLGTMYDERQTLFDELRRHYRGDIDIIGTKLGRKGEMPGAIPNEELVKHYWGTKIALTPNRTTAGYFDKTQIASKAYSLGPRVYELAACGTFQLTDDSRAELFDVFGNTIPVYVNAEHLACLIDLFIKYPRWRGELAERARIQVKPCTFENRAKEILFPTLQEVLSWQTKGTV